MKVQGRPTKYDPKFDEQVFKLALLGATDKEIANFFNVAESTLNLWKKNENFSESLKKGKVEADVEVAAAMYKLATGYNYTEEQATANGSVVKLSKYQHANERSNARWLHNRRANWRENAHTEEKTLKIEFTNTKKKK